MEFDLKNGMSVLERTPEVLQAYLRGLPTGWTRSNEGIGTWSPFDIVGHLIHGEKTDWIVRTRIILSDHENKNFEPFDREAQIKNNLERTLDDLLDEFEGLRRENLNELRFMDIRENELLLEGIHPHFGAITLKQLLSTWVAHDLGHIAQISRVMAKQYKEEVGPWSQYLGILNK